LPNEPGKSARSCARLRVDGCATFSYDETMKPFPLFVSLALLLAAGTARTALPNDAVEVKSELKRVDVKRNASLSTESSEEAWTYAITVTNHSFHPIPDLRVDYVEFSRHEVFGSKARDVKSQRKRESKAFGTFENNGELSFETEPVTLKKARLKADWYYSNGAKAVARDAMTGVWVRVFSGNEMIGEYAQPSSLKTDEKWDD
jgi:hypothetical protein